MSQITLLDTTLRDGAQTEGISFSVEDKVKIARKLDELGIHYVEGGWPTPANPTDVEFFERLREGVTPGSLPAGEADLHVELPSIVAPSWLLSLMMLVCLPAGAFIAGSRTNRRRSPGACTSGPRNSAV